MPRQYQSYIRNHWPLPFVQPWLYGPTKFAKRPFKYNFILCTHFGDKSGWHYYAADLVNLGRQMDKYLAGSKQQAKFFAAAEKNRKANFTFSEKVKKIKINELEQKALAALLKEWYLIHSKFCAAYMPIDATDETLETDIRQAFKEAKINLSLPEITCLLTPDTESYIQKENREFCQLLKKNSDLKSQAVQSLLKKYAEKWWWAPMDWGQHQPLTVKDLAQKISRIKDLKAFIKQEEQKERQRPELLHQKKLILKKLPKDVLSLLKAFEILAKMHDARKEIQIRMLTAGFKITAEILRRSAVPLGYRDFILVEEYLALAQGSKLDLKAIASRKKYFWCQAVGGGKISLFSGQVARRKINRSRIYQTAAKSEKIIHGLTASPGQAEGRVRVGLESKALLAKFKNGEILATGMTTPDFVPIMKKAAAIVTDEGGITCHAAIISRELGIPCVIGTKNGTKILKTGDLVAVDANQGIVRKI